MDQTEVFTLQELAKIKAIKQEKGIQSDAELIRFLLNEMEKNFCRKCLYKNKPGKNYGENKMGNEELAIAIGDRIAERTDCRTDRGALFGHADPDAGSGGGNSRNFKREDAPALQCGKDSVHPD